MDERFTVPLHQHRATMTCDLLSFLSGDNSDLLCGETYNFEAVCGSGPNEIAVLPYPPG